MTYEQVKGIVDNIPNGRIFKVDMTTNANSHLNKTGKASGWCVKKHTVMPCRKGIEYSNTNYIKMITDELGYQVGKRANGVKADKTFTDSFKGNKLIDLFATDCKADRLTGKPINMPKTEYIVSLNGGAEKIVSRQELEALGIMQPSYFSNKDKEKYEKMVAMKAEWELDKSSYPQNKKDELAKLIRDMYNKLFSPNVENINSIG